MIFLAGVPEKWEEEEMRVCLREKTDRRTERERERERRNERIK